MSAEGAGQTASARFEEMLEGGHPNSLGRTVEVVEIVLGDRKRLEELFRCYSSDDETVRLRASSAFKRIFRERRDWFADYVDRFQALVPELRQPSAQWTLAQLHLELEDALTPAQKKTAVAIAKDQLERSGDWIVLIQSVNLLDRWARDDAALRRWLAKRLEALAGDARKSVAKRAARALAALSSA